MQRSDNLTVWRLIRACGQESSIRAAAESENTDPVVASRLISQLETELGVRLFDRSKKPAVPTEMLTAMLPFVRKMLRAQEAVLALAEKSRSSGSVVRVIRVSVPANMNRQSLIEKAEDWSSRRTGVRVEFVTDANISGLVNDSVDISVVGYKPDLPQVVALPLTKTVPLILASKSYVARYGAPETPADLAGHTLIMRGRYNAGMASSATLYKGDEIYFVGNAPKIIYGDGMTCRTALLMGQGIALDIDSAVVAQELASGLLVPVLPGWHRKPWHDHICFLNSRRRDKTVRELVSVLQKAFYAHFIDSWQYWYKRFGIPLDCVKDEEP